MYVGGSFMFLILLGICFYAIKDFCERRKESRSVYDNYGNDDESGGNQLSVGLTPRSDENQPGNNTGIEGGPGFEPSTTGYTPHQGTVAAPPPYQPGAY
eukprot:TRINITY_DN9202_c0_g1_i1.p2 TRINITY_DN9202_c0_g1~~TRINITY_DN9202_c0_g1_i1.p2  ORF type:complete len:99 (+),score=14.01 TRINITY_DN9202_c0_g1_i1:496-792(+)